MARKAVRDVFRRRNDERRRFFVMERAARLKIRSSLFQGNVFGDELNDVDLVLYVFRNRHSAVIGFVAEYSTRRAKGKRGMG